MSVPTNIRRLQLTERQKLDLEQILCGGFAPLKGFLKEGDYRSVVARMRLKSGALWPMPIVLDVPESDSYTLGECLVLCDTYGYPIAFFTIQSMYTPDKKLEARSVYGTESLEHPGVRYLFEETHNVYLGGPVERIGRTHSYDFKELRFSPDELKSEIKKRKWKKVVAFQTRNPIHRAHYEVIRRAMRETGAKALLHPVAGLTKEGDIDYVRRVRGYKHVVKKYFGKDALLAVLPIAMRMAGPREAVWHALIRKNYGATHFIIGRDHAGPGANSLGEPFYEPYAAQRLAKKTGHLLGINIVIVPEMVFAKKRGEYVAVSELKQDDTPLHISGTKFREMLANGEPIPEWFSFPEVIHELRNVKKPGGGAVIFLSGLPCAGKTTIARIVYQKLLDMRLPDVQLLDGDVVRAHYKKKLGFSRRDRITNVKRMGSIAEKIARTGGIAICAAVAPHKVARDANKKLIGRHAKYIEVFVHTPLKVCEERDTKGLYKKARAGLIKNFTGIDDPYEIPDTPDIKVDTTKTSAIEAANIILKKLSAFKIL